MTAVMEQSDSQRSLTRYSLIDLLNPEIFLREGWPPKRPAVTPETPRPAGADEAERAILGSAIPLKAAVRIGVYFLIREARVVYVGQTRNLFARLSTHRHDPRFTFDAFTFMECAVEELDEREAYYIRLLRPEHNGVFPDGRMVVKGNRR